MSSKLKSYFMVPLRGDLEKLFSLLEMNDKEK